ncbi:MAG: glycosyltransferase family 9 protein [Candidatus Eiseniibacteriota bacterium]
MNRRLDRLVGVPLVAALSVFAARHRGIPSAPARILVIKLAAAGDTVLLVPTLRALRRRFPAAHIHWLVSPVNEELARTVPYVDGWTAWDGRFGSLAKLVAQLRDLRFDVALDFEQWARGSALLAFLSGAPVRLGFDTPGQSRAGLFTRACPKSSGRHELLEFLSVASLLAEVDLDTTLELWETEAGRAELQRATDGHDWEAERGPRIVLHPGCGTDGAPREWPLDRYAELGSWLERTRGARLFLTGGPDEVEKTDRLARALHGRALDLGGGLSWPGTISLVRRVDLVVSGNTGIMHVAAALAKPQVALHGPTNPLLWGPRNPRARVLQADLPAGPSLVLGFEYRPEDRDCMRTIRLEQVTDAVGALLDERRG